MEFRERIVGQTNYLKPRFLTEEEKDDIVEIVPRPESDEIISSEVSRIVTMHNVRLQLNRIKLVPHELVFERMKQFILKRFKTAQIPLGSRVGLFVADALGATSTQITLDTFKLIGVSSIGNGIKGFKNLLYLPLNRTDPSMTIHFLTKVTRDDIIEMRSLIEAVVVESFVKRFEIGAFNRIDEPETPERYAILHDPDEVIILESKWWHKVYDSISESPSYYPAHIMRLHMDTQKMYEHRVTMDQISRALQNFSYEKVGRTDVIEFDVVTSPFEDGIIDIIPKKTIELVEGIPYPVRTFLYNIIRPGLRKIHVKGVVGISKLLPVTIDLKRAFDDKNIRKSSEGDDLWILPLNRKFLHSKFINPQQLRDILHQINIELVKDINTPLLEKTRATFQNMFNLNLPDSPNRDLEAFLIRMPDHITTGKAAWNHLLNLWSDMNINVEYTYAVTIGDNLSGINRFSFVDTNRTITNNIRQISSMYGVETARDYYIYEFLEILREITDISSRNLTLLADFIFAHGQPIGINFGSESKRGKSGMASAVNSKFKQAVFSAAVHGKYESTKSIPVGLITGSRGPFEEIDPQKIREKSARLKLERRYRLDPDSFKKTNLDPVEEITEPVSEQSPADLIKSLGLINFNPATAKDMAMGIKRPEIPVEWPEMDLAIVERRPVAVSKVFPVFYRASLQQYMPIVQKHLDVLEESEKNPQQDEYTKNIMSVQNAINTYALFQAQDLDYSKFRQILSNNNMSEIPEEIKSDYIDFVWVQSKHKAGFGDAHRHTQTYLKSILAKGKDALSNKQLLHLSIEKNLPDIYERHVPRTFDLKDDVSNFRFEQGEVYIIRPVGRVFFSAEGIVVVDTMEAAMKARQDLTNYDAIVSRWIKNPLLHQQKKIHIRAYLSIAKGPNVPDGFMWSVCNVAKIITAKLPYVNADYSNADIHDTHMFRSSQDLFFPDDLEVPVGSPHTRQSLGEHIFKQIRTILEAVSLMSREEITIYPESTNAFEVFGVDLMVTDETEDFNVYLIEINSHTGYGGLDSQKNFGHNWNNITGPWTEKFSDFSQRFFEWVYDSTVNPIFLNKSIETKVIVEAPQPVTIVESKITTPTSKKVETVKRKLLPVSDWILKLSKENMLDTESLVFKEIEMKDIRLLEAYLEDIGKK